MTHRKAKGGKKNFQVFGAEEFIAAITQHIPEKSFQLEVDPLLCPKCGGEMLIFSFITDNDVIRKIFDHLGDGKKSPPLNALRPS